MEEEDQGQVDSDRETEDRKGVTRRDFVGWGLAAIIGGVAAYLGYNPEKRSIEPKHLELSKLSELSPEELKDLKEKWIKVKGFSSYINETKLSNIGFDPVGEIPVPVNRGETTLSFYALSPSPAQQEPAAILVYASPINKANNPEGREVAITGHLGVFSPAELQRVGLDVTKLPHQLQGGRVFYINALGIEQLQPTP